MLSKLGEKIFKVFLQLIGFNLVFVTNQGNNLLPGFVFFDTGDDISSDRIGREGVAGSRIEDKTRITGGYIFFKSHREVNDEVCG